MSPLPGSICHLFFCVAPCLRAQNPEYIAHTAEHADFLHQGFGEVGVCPSMAHERAAPPPLRSATPSLLTNPRGLPQRLHSVPASLFPLSWLRIPSHSWMHGLKPTIRIPTTTASSCVTFLLCVVGCGLSDMYGVCCADPYREAEQEYSHLGHHQPHRRASYAG
jgi:hypothetical protein